MSGSQRVLLAGCGRLGLRLAPILSASGYHVTALSRRKPSGKGIQKAFAGDLTVPTSMTELDKGFDAVVYSPTPDNRDADAYRKTFCDGLKYLLKRGTLKPDGRLMFVSSTAVYGQDNGQWVDENSPTEPSRFNGKVLLEAEQLARSGLESQAYPYRTTIFRLGGLYGDPDNYLVRQLLSGSIKTDNLDNWTNRIHLDDAAGLIAHWLNNNLSNPIVNGVDNTPTLRVELLAWLAEQLCEIRTNKKLGALLDKLQQHQTNEADFSGKRIHNDVAGDSGYAFQYPDYRSGYAGIIQKARQCILHAKPTLISGIS